MLRGIITEVELQVKIAMLRIVDSSRYNFFRLWSPRLRSGQAGLPA